MVDRMVVWGCEEIGDRSGLQLHASRPPGALSRPAICLTQDKGAYPIGRIERAGQWMHSRFPTDFPVIRIQGVPP